MTALFAVAEHADFSDAKKLNTYFRKATGLTPPPTAAAVP